MTSSSSNGSLKPKIKKEAKSAEETFLIVSIPNRLSCTLKYNPKSKVIAVTLLNNFIKNWLHPILSTLLTQIKWHFPVNFLLNNVKKQTLKSNPKISSQINIQLKIFHQIQKIINKIMTLNFNKLSVLDLLQIIKPKLESTGKLTLVTLSPKISKITAVYCKKVDLLLSWKEELL